MCFIFCQQENFENAGAEFEPAIDIPSTSGRKRKESPETSEARKQSKKVNTSINSINRVHVREWRRRDLTKKRTDPFKWINEPGDPSKLQELLKLLTRWSKYL